MSKEYKENFEFELRKSLELYPELHNFDKDIFKDLFINSGIELYENFKTPDGDFDFFAYFKDTDGLEYRACIDLRGTPEYGHCAYFPTKDYDFTIDGVDLELWQSYLPNARKRYANLNYPYLEVFTLGDLNSQLSRLWDGLYDFSTPEILMSEYELIKRTPGRITAQPTQNKIIKHFNPHYFKNHNITYSNPTLRRKLIQNRMKYKYKAEHEISTKELLIGCRISKICETFSNFSPLWFKYFIEKYDIKSVYDPFGGWGHRLLGSHNLDLYIYNDISPMTYAGVKGITEFLSLKNVELYNCNAIDFKPTSQYEAVFTCPPYDNLEAFEIPVQDFKELMLKGLDCGSKLYGIVIPEKYENFLCIGKLLEKTPVNTIKSHFGKKNFEYLYVYTK